MNVAGPRSQICKGISCGMAGFAGRCKARVERWRGFGALGYTLVRSAGTVYALASHTHTAARIC
jgi:hypothetical protein